MGGLTDDEKRQKQAELKMQLDQIAKQAYGAAD